jgi:hypothetical protein
MASLIELHTDAPLSWEAVMRRNAEWHSTHDREGNLTVPPVAPFPCWGCANRRHGRCNGGAGSGAVTKCSCALFGHAA